MIPRESVSATSTLRSSDSRDSTNRWVRYGLLAASVLCAVPAQATDGYFTHGYGMVSKGMAGAATAVAEAGFAGANNPASAAFAGNRLDIGVDWFVPRREISRSGSAGGMLDFSADSDSTNFFIPEFAFNRQQSERLGWGISVYGHGGMNTDFEGGQLDCSALGGPPVANGLCGVGTLGVNLEQLMVAPTVAWRFTNNHSVGIAPVYSYQRFKVEGVQLFQFLSQSPGEVTNRGTDISSGWGVRVGYLGNINSAVSVGATYASRTRADQFDRYEGLFAGEGDFDIPQNLTVGVAIRPGGGLLAAIDWQRIHYSDIESVGNPSSNPSPLGSSKGPGFGWRDVDVWKFGLQWQFNPELTLRAGYNHTDNPIRPRDVTFNLIAPGVIEDHVTLGLSWRWCDDNDITLAYMHAFSNSTSGPSFFNAFAPGMGGTEKLEMYQNSLGVAWNRRW